MRSKGPYLRLYAKPVLIRALMTLKGIPSGRELAVKANVGKDIAARFTSGDMVDTSTENAEKLARILGVKTELLFVEPRTTLPDLDEVAA